jgi:prephenate dehydrogenase
MFETLNMRVTFMDSDSHDRHAAYVSHISHISSFALALTVLDQEKNERHIFDLASGGFDSTVRLAKSSAEMWSPIFEQNASNVVEVLNTYIEKLNQFKDAISQGERKKIDELINKSNHIKKILK